MVVGFIRPNEGEVFLDNEPITSLPMYKRAQRGIGYLPQEPSVFRKLSVEDNIRAVLEMTPLSPDEQKKAGIAAGGIRIGNQAQEPRRHPVRRRAAAHGNRPLTGYQSQIHSPRRALCRYRPDRGGGHPVHRRQVADQGIGILITDHNVQETLSITDRAYLMFEGKILKAGTADELAADEMVRKVYLGTNFELRKKVIDLD